MAFLPTLARCSNKVNAPEQQTAKGFAFIKMPTDAICLLQKSVINMYLMNKIVALINKNIELKDFLFPMPVSKLSIYKYMLITKFTSPPPFSLQGEQDRCRRICLG